MIKSGQINQGSVTSLFQEINEKFRDHALDELCAGLQALGIPAQMSVRGRPEEKITSGRGKSLGVIDIAGSAIRWVNVKKRATSGGQYGGGGIYWYAEYGVPDPNMGLTYPSVNIESIRVKKIPLIGKVIGLRWKGKDFGLGILFRLTGDVSLAQPIIASDDLEIEAYPEHGCYLLTVQRCSAPSEMLWNCYQTIAGHLLARQVPPGSRNLSRKLRRYYSAKSKTR